VVPDLNSKATFSAYDLFFLFKGKTFFVQATSNAAPLR